MNYQKRQEKDSLTYSNSFLVILFVSLFVVGIVVYINISTTNREDALLKKVVEIETKIDKLSEKKDSLIIIIDSIDNKLQKNENEYQEKVNSILNQSSHDDSVFISDYLRRFLEKSYGDYIY